MNSEVTVIGAGGAAALTAAQMKSHIQRVQQVIRGVMKKDVHYGVIPGTDKPSLLKPGAEVLCATFHIAPTYEVTDLSDEDCVRYRVVCIGTHQTTGIVIAHGLGECSSNEEKYKWKRAYDREFNATDEDRRRVKYGYDRQRNQEYETLQVRTNPADVANTILKMACKRAQVAMTLNGVAASDCFSQDLEDLPEGMMGEDPAPAGARTQTRSGPSAPRSTGGKGCASDKQVKLVLARLTEAGLDGAILCEEFGIKEVAELPFGKVDAALSWIKNGGK